MAEKTRGQKIAEAQRKNAEVRAYLADMNSVQMNNFIRKLDPRTVKRVRRSLEAYDEAASGLRRTQIEKEIKKLQDELAEIA